MRSLFCLTVLTILLSSCSSTPASVSSSEFAEWTRQGENGLTHEKVIGDIIFTVSFIPKEQMALMETGEDPTPEEWQKALEAKGNMQYFKLTYKLTNSNQDILKYNLFDENEYFSRTNYLAFGVDKDVYLQCGKDRMPCRMHQYAPHYGISPQAEVLFAFDPADTINLEDQTFVIEDQLFNSGMLQFEFAANDLKNIPTIQF